MAPTVSNIFYPFDMLSPTTTMMSSHLMDQQSLPLSTLFLRGGSQTSENLDMYVRSAVGYFNNLRVPAAVLMSIVMKEMFALQTTPPGHLQRWDKKNGIDVSKRWRVLRYSYLLLMVLAFSSETFTIFVATQVLTQLATQRVGPLRNIDHVADSTGQESASSMVEFLIQNFEFEYASCRFHFLTGLLSFAIAQALRVRYALRKYSDLSMCGMCCLLTVTTGMLAYANTHTITYGGYINLFKRHIVLSVKFLADNIRSRSGPLCLATGVLACTTLVYAVKGAISPEFAYFNNKAEDVEE